MQVAKGDLRDGLRFQAPAIEALQEAAEAYLVSRCALAEALEYVQGLQGHKMDNQKWVQVLSRLRVSSIARWGSIYLISTGLLVCVIAAGWCF